MELYEEVLLPQANTARQAVLSAFATGNAEFPELLDAEERLYTLGLGFEDAVARYLNASAALERAVGVTSLAELQPQSDFLSMQLNAKTIALVLLAAALAAAGFLLGRSTTEKSRAPAEDADERTVLYWQAPMNPSEIYDRPGKSAMGMDLVPVYEEATGGTVSIDPVTVQNMGVRTDRVTRMDLHRSVRTVGTVEFDEESLYAVNAKISGWIDKLHVNFVGDSVRKGDPLLEIYSPDLVAAQQAYLLALSSYRNAAASSFASAREDAAQLLASARQRLELWEIQPTELERLEETRQISRAVVLNAPATGIVVEKHAVEGAYLEAGADLLLIADLSTVWVHASLRDSDLPWVHVGQSATMESAYLPGETYAGRVNYIYPFLREDARDVLARLEFSNPRRKLMPGMYVNVLLEGSVQADALVVPNEAVIYSGSRHVAFVVHTAGTFEPRVIRVGEKGGTGGNYTRVLHGLTEGEEVVTSAQFMLDSESRLQQAIRKMLPQQEPPSEHSAH